MFIAGTTLTCSFKIMTVTHKRALFNLVNKTNLALVTLYGWLSLPDSHPYRVTSAKCHINTVVAPDDGHIVAQNM